MRLPFFVDLPNSQRGRRSGWVSMTPQGTANLFSINGNFRSAAALFVLYALRSFLLFTILFLFPYTVITWTRRFIFPVLALLSPDPDPLSPCGRGSSRIRPMLVLVAREGSRIATIRSW